ncbi:hypothetical protein GCM10010254_71080 [Streptomyces chromofuscus]|nr:hypothetical protein GCM10010254_71080 [Streptomyces chromofuscus]
MSVTEPKVVLVTGAGSGIGQATARHLAAIRHRVVAGARRTDRLAAPAAECDGAVDGVELDVIAWTACTPSSRTPWRGTEESTCWSTTRA